MAGWDVHGRTPSSAWIAPAEITARGYLGGVLQGEASCESPGALWGETGCITPSVSVDVDGVVLPEEDGATACSDVILFEGEGDDGQVSVGPVTLEGQACWTYHEDSTFEDPFGDGDDDGGGSDPGDPGPCRTCT